MRKLWLACIAVLSLFASSASGQATSSWVFFGPNNKLQYHTDSNGNRVIDFSYAGYRGGGVALPSVPVAMTVSPISGDNTAHIQSAIDSVSALAPDVNGFRGAVLLQAGTYEVDGTLNITTSGVVLRGSGSGTTGTVLNMAGSPHLLISVIGSGTWQTVGGSASMTDTYVPSGAMSFNVNDASGFSVGDTILINRPVTQDWVHFMSMDDLVRNGAPQTWLAVGSTITTDRTIQAISGNQITVDAPLTDSFDSSLLTPPGGSIVKYTFPTRISEVGVEHLRIIAPAQDVDISNPQYQALTMDAVINGWVQDLQIQDTDNTISIGGATKQITVDNVTVTHSLAFTHSAGPADFSVSGTRNLVNKGAVKGNTGVWAYVTQARVTGPIVLLNCSGDLRGFAPHQRWATGLLADSAQFPGGTSSTPGIAYSDRGNAGSGQGWDAGWAVAWNVTSPNLLVQEPPGSHNWCIGCVGTEVSASEPGGDGTLLPNGIYDSLGTPVTPSSLYLEQLRERLGNQSLVNIGYGFTISGTPTNRSITAGSSTTYSVSYSPGVYFSGATIFSVSGLPSGASASFSPSSLSTAGTSTLTVTTSTSTVIGSYLLTITGTNGKFSWSDTVTLVVTGAGTATGYEAEATGNTFSGTAAVGSCSGCSGGSKVRFIGNGSANTLTVNNVNVASAGSYTLTIYYLVSGTRTFFVSTNGGAAVQVTVSGTSWSVPDSTSINVVLSAGSNSIKFFNNTANAPDLDRITISPPATALKSYEAEASSNTFSGTAAPGSCSGCSGGIKVRFLGNGSANTVTVNNVNVALPGTYTQTISYVVNGTRTFAVSVNGGTPMLVTVSGTTWDAPATTTMSVLLNAGSNSIKFENDTAFAPDLDRITVK
jgi:hypothetical protein